VKHLASELRAAIDRAMQADLEPEPVRMPISASHALQGH
jgi:hypothetical protein